MKKNREYLYSADIRFEKGTLRDTYNRMNEWYGGTIQFHDKDYTFEKEALDKGLISEADLDGHLRKTLTGRFELGMFDPEEMLPWANLGEDVISSESNHQLAIQAARESMVLLKNQPAKGQTKNVLPLSKSLKNIAVVGPNADDVELLNGNYGGTPTKNHERSLVQGIRDYLPGANIIYNKACDLQDEYNTFYYLPKMNGGQGVKVEFFENKQLAGEPAKTQYMKERLNFSTFGAWGFAEGVNSDSIAVRISGQFTADFTGAMSYTVGSDNGYVLKVNGAVVEEQKQGQSRRFGFRRTPVYKTFEVENGKTYDVLGR